MDAHEQLTVESEACFAVVGKGEDFLLIRLDDGVPLDDATTARAHQGGFAYCGVFGIKNGEICFRIARENRGAVYTMMFASVAFVRQAADRLTAIPKSKGDSVEWLTGLFDLVDARGH